MKHYGIALFLVLLTAGCGKEHGGVSGSEPREILDDVEQQLEKSSEAAAEQLEQALEKIDADN